MVSRSLKESILNRLYLLSNLHGSDELNVFGGLCINCPSVEAAPSFLIIKSVISVTYLCLYYRVHPIRIFTLEPSRDLSPFCLLLHHQKQGLDFMKKRTGGIFLSPTFYI